MNIVPTCSCNHLQLQPVPLLLQQEHTSSAHAIVVSNLLSTSDVCRNPGVPLSHTALQVLDILGTVAVCERASIDECYLDLTEEAHRRMAAAGGSPPLPVNPEQVHVASLVSCSSPCAVCLLEAGRVQQRTELRLCSRRAA